MAGVKTTLICQLLWLLLCIKGFPGFQFRKTLLCESLTGFLSCGSRDDLVVVKKAIYGRQLPYPRICGDLTGRAPCSLDTTATLLPYCFRSQNCSFPNTDTFHGHPCIVARQGKYLSFDVACVPAEDIYPVCGISSSNTPVALPLPDQGLLAPPFYTARNQRPWRCDVKISGARAMTFEVINDDNGRVPVMACGKDIFVGDLRAYPGCRPLTKNDNYTISGDVSLYFYNTNDTGPQALVYYQVIQKDVLSILTASREVHPTFFVETSTLAPLTPEMSTEGPRGNMETTESAMNKNVTKMAPVDSSTDNGEETICNTTLNANMTDGDMNRNRTCVTASSPAVSQNVGAQTASPNTNTSETIATDASIQTKDSILVTTASGILTGSTATSSGAKTEPPKIISGNRVPVNTSSDASSKKSGAIPAYLVGIIVGVLGLIILLLIVAFIVAVCKRREKTSREDDMAALSQDRDKTREMNIYSTIDIHEGPSDEKPSFIRSGKKNKQDTIEKAKAAAQDKTNSSFNPSEIWYEDKVDFVMY